MSIRFKTPYGRPEKLSDPHSDFTDGMLNKLLTKNDGAFDWSDYSNLFGPHLPAGTYEEVVYFLPQAFSYLKHHEDEALDLVTPIFGFCSKNIDNLLSDGLLEVVKSEIMDCLNHWTRDFRVVHFDKNACLKKGWGLDYNDLVVNSEVICEGTSDLARFETLEGVAARFTESLAHHNGNVIKASWFLEYSRARFDVYTPPNSKSITELLANEELLNHAYATIWTDVIDQHASPTYWQDTLNQLGI